MNQDIKYKLKKNIVIKAGTEIISAPTEIKFHAPCYEILIGFGKNYSASVFLDDSLIESNPDHFIPCSCEDQ